MQTQKTLVDYLFLRFSFVWDKKWEHKLKGAEEEKRRMWEVAISGLTRQQLNDAIDVATTKFDWPPEPRAFLECCPGKKKSVAPTQDMRDKVLVDRKNNIWVSKCTIHDCKEPGTMSRDMRGDSYICNKHWNEGR
jgi:hypothetical protein